jgi:hypothetical protein
MDDNASYTKTIGQYASYELDDILHNMDRARFPERYELVMQEISRRAKSRASVEQSTSTVNPSAPPLEKPHTIRELISDLVQPVEGKKAIGVTYTTDLLLWTVLALMAVIAIPEVIVFAGTEGNILRAATVLILAVQFQAIGAALMKRACTAFCLKFWAVFLVIYVAANVRVVVGELVSVVGAGALEDTASIWSAELMVPIAVSVIIAVALFAFAERCIRPVFTDHGSTV